MVYEKLYHNPICQWYDVYHGYHIYRKRLSFKADALLILWFIRLNREVWQSTDSGWFDEIKN